jgi:trehalose-6-phosphate synthase
MRLNIALIVSIIVAVGIVAMGFTVHQISNERAKLNAELEVRSSKIAHEFISRDFTNLEHYHSGKLKRSADSLAHLYHILGIAIYYNNDSIITPDTSVNGFLTYSEDYISQAITADTAVSDYFSIDGRSIYQYIQPVYRQDIRNIAVVFYSDAEYIDNIIKSIWFRNFMRWFLQALLVSFITVLIIRWGIFSPINKIVKWVRAARSGNIDHLQQNPPANFLAPLHNEIVNIAKAMHEAKAKAEEEAKLRTSGIDAWTPERLKIEMGILLQNKKMVVVSNREPYMHIHEGKSIKVIVPASGLITAMEPVLNACGGLWIASGTGDADKETVDENDCIQVPPEDPKYTLKRLWLTKEEENHFYYGFSNEGLWPLCHISHTRPVFRKEDWHYYKKVNEQFAKAVLKEIENEEQPLVLIQDYHFALLPALIKKKRPDARVAIFWHIPWPNPESFGICPWQEEILEGMLGADLIGFHTQYHCNHFLETVNNSLESRVLWENFSATISGHTTFVKPFPISIDFTLKDLEHAHLKAKARDLLADHGISAELMGIGVDRLDYTKGIVEKFLAIERFLEKYPHYKGRFTFVQIGAPSRTLLKTYSDMVNAVENEANRINWKFKTKDWKPILLLKRHHSHDEIYPFYASANLCMVTSLHDGMNLVAKEFVAARDDNRGALILSQFAGALQELQGAISINPYNIEGTADAIKTALEMSNDEQVQRMNQMRQNIVTNNIYYWAASLLRSMISINNLS